MNAAVITALIWRSFAGPRLVCCDRAIARTVGLHEPRVLRLPVPSWSDDPSPQPSFLRLWTTATHKPSTTGVLYVL